jgi:hypothetical protein
MNHDSVRVAGDAISFGIVVGTLVKLLPAIAALASFIWYSILIWEKFKKKK